MKRLSVPAPPPREFAVGGHHEFPGLHPRARRQRLRRTVHPDPQGEPPVGADLRDGRRPAAGLAGVQASVQRAVDPRAPRLPNAGPSPKRRLLSRGDRGMITVSSVSKKPRAVHSIHEATGTSFVCVLRSSMIPNLTVGKPSVARRFLARLLRFSRE